ncbi:MAG: HD domain-containing protein [Myxococcaceae bacterium]
MPRLRTDSVLGAIDVGTNAVRLELARVLPDGSLETLHQERDPVRPGEGVFTRGYIPGAVAERLLSTLTRYASLCRRHHAQVRAVATSALREARNRDEIVLRAKRDAGIRLEVISGVEEARLICLGVLHGKGPKVRSVCIDIGGGSTEVATALGESPLAMWSVALGAVRLTDLFKTSGVVSPKQLKLIRRFASEAVREALPNPSLGGVRVGLGSSGTIGAVVGYATDGAGYATANQVARAVDKLADMTPAERRKCFDPKRAEIIVGGAVILEAVLEHLRLKAVTAVSRGLRDGILVDLVAQQRVRSPDSGLTDAAIKLGRRFGFDEGHSKQVARLSLALFDQLSAMHALPASARPLLEVAALLHDIGNAVSYARHHKHSFYLIQNADIPGLSDRERDLVALTARFHRRSFPLASHPELARRSAQDVRLVRKLAALLRIADSLDRGHRQVVQKLVARAQARTVRVRLWAKAPLDLELWDVESEAGHFRNVFRHGIIFSTQKLRAN